MDGFLSDLGNAIPGFVEAMSFAEILKLVQTMDYSVRVFDTALIGHTVLLLQFPSTLEKGLAKMMTLKNKFGGLISQMTRLFGGGDEFGEDTILGKLEGMKDVIEQVNKQFKDPVCSIEALKSFSRHFLSLYRPSMSKGTVEELERRVSTLREQLKSAEAELGRPRKEKQKV